MRRNIMSRHGAIMQSYNQELVKCLEDLKHRRGEVQVIVMKQQEEKQSIEFKIQELQGKLKNVSAQLNTYTKLKEAYDRAINETEAGYQKILETSEALLNAIKIEATRLNKHGPANEKTIDSV